MSSSEDVQHKIDSLITKLSDKGKLFKLLSRNVLSITRLNPTHRKLTSSLGLELSESNCRCRY
jgi:hypothetical protein